MYDPKVGRRLSEVPVAGERGGAYRPRDMNDRRPPLDRASGTLQMKSIGDGPVFTPTGNELPTGLKYFWWGVALYGDREEMEALRAQRESLTEDGAARVGSVMLHRQIDLEFSACGSGKSYRFDQQGWFLSRLEMTEDGKLVTGTGAHNLGAAEMADGTVALNSFLSAGFDPGSWLFVGRTPRRGLQERREEARRSRGQFLVEFQAQLFVGDISTSGFAPHARVHDGLDAFGEMWRDYQKSGIHSAITEPQAWRQSALSSAAARVTISWDYSDEERPAFSAEGDVLPAGPNRKRVRGVPPGSIVLHPSENQDVWVA